jgi:hypothetical protein
MSPPSPAAPDPIPLESEPTPEEGAPGPSEPIPGTAQPVRRSLGKVPKWLKLPGACHGLAGWDRAAGQELRALWSSWCVCTTASKR